jgi:hypothetical protein
MGCVIELCGIEQSRTRIGSTASFGVESHQFLSAKLHLGRAPGVQTASYFRLAAGEHSWPFQIQLPAELPPSVEHPSGNARIVYEVRAHMTTPGDRDGKAFVIFNVVSVPRHRTPKAVERSIDKPFGLQRNEPLHVRAVLQHDLYVPGELLKLRFFVDNASRKTITGFRFDIVCEWRYGKEKTAEVISSSEFAPTELFPLMPRAMFETVAGCALPAGPLAQSIAGQTLSCTYRLRVTAEVAGITNRDVTFDLPFVVVSSKPKAPPSPRAPTKSASSSSASSSTSPATSSDYSLAPPPAPKAPHSPSAGPRSPRTVTPTAPQMSDPANYGAVALPSYEVAVGMPHSAYAVPTRPQPSAPPAVTVDAPPPAPAPAGTFTKRKSWISDEDFVKIDDRNDDHVDDLVVDQSLPAFNPELGRLTAPSVNWGVSPRASPNASPRASPNSSPKSDHRKTSK